MHFKPDWWNSGDQGFYQHKASVFQAKSKENLFFAPEFHQSRLHWVVASMASKGNDHTNKSKKSGLLKYGL